MKDLTTLAKKYKELLAQRRELEAQANSIKQDENDVKQQILALMAADNIKSIKLQDVGYVLAVEKKHLEIRDKELFSQAIMASMINAYKNGRELMDGLIVQARPAKDGLEVFLDESGRQLSDCGLVEITVTDLSLRKA